MATYDSDKMVSIFGVPGRLTHRTTKPGQSADLWFKQRWISEQRTIDGYGRGAYMVVEIRFDDECGNRHNSFAITADVRIPGRRDIEAGGCLHGEIAEVFPELAPLIKWHLVSTDGPMYYLANTLYHASDADYNGHRAGDPCAWGYGVRVGNDPITHIIKHSFWSFLKERYGSRQFQTLCLPYEKTTSSDYDFSPKYTFVGYGEKWHDGPFDSETEAVEWAAALNNSAVEFVKIPTKFSNGKQRDLNAARSCAVWPEATDEELSAPRDELEKKLKARLPRILAEFRADIERIGFYWSPEDLK